MDATAATEPGVATAANGSGEQRNVGRIEEIQGVVIEAVFPDQLPEINTALHIKRTEANLAEDEGTLGEVGRKHERLFAERVLRDHRRLGIGQRKLRSGSHRLPVLAPRSRNTHEARAELPAARVTFVGGAERNRRHRAAVRALRTKP